MTKNNENGKSDLGYSRRGISSTRRRVNSMFFSKSEASLNKAECNSGYPPSKRMQLKPGLVQRGANKEENKELKFTKEQLEKPGFFGPEQRFCAKIQPWHDIRDK